MNDSVVNALAFIGGALVLGSVAFLIIFGIGLLRNFIDLLRWKHTYKHRFDKPPTARCYCKDCSMHHKSGKCDLPGNSRYTPDDGFCYESEPIDYKQSIERFNDSLKEGQCNG